MEPFKVFIRNEPSTLDFDVYILRSQNMDGKQEFFVQDGEHYKTCVVERGDAIKPFFTVPHDLLPDLLKALHNQGVKLPDKGHTEGKLEATSKHLEDMRALVFDRKQEPGDIKP